MANPYKRDRLKKEQVTDTSASEKESTGGTEGERGDVVKPIEENIEETVAEDATVKEGTEGTNNKKTETKQKEATRAKRTKLEADGRVATKTADVSKKTVRGAEIDKAVLQFVPSQRELLNARTSFALPPSLLDRIDKAKELNGFRSRNGLVIKILEEALKDIDVD